jgi:hypothetical protein
MSAYLNISVYGDQGHVGIAYHKALPAHNMKKRSCLAFLRLSGSSQTIVPSVRRDTSCCTVTCLGPSIKAQWITRYVSQFNRNNCVWIQGCTNPVSHAVQAIEFFTVVPKFCKFWVLWNLRHVILLEPRILKWLRDFLETFSNHKLLNDCT